MDLSGFTKSLYEISNLNVIFTMTFMDELTSSRDYGTGKKYTMLEVHTVSLIEKAPGITVTEISRLFNRTKSTVSQLCTRLQNKGLIVKTKQSGDDKKLRRLYVTQEGRKLSIAHIEYDNIMMKPYLSDLLNHLSVEELNTVFRYMELVITERIGIKKQT